MESMKQAASNLMGSGNTTQSGQEPVSGQTGAGTVNEPYDQGNQYGAYRLLPPLPTAILQ